MTTECWRGDAAREWCHPLKPKAPAPTQAGPLAAGGGILLGRQLTSRAAPAQVLAALMQARPAPAGRQPPGRAGAVLRLVPFRPPRPIFPARSQQLLGGSSVTSPVGVRWVGGMCLCPNQFFLSALPRLLGRIRASQPGHVWSNVKGSSGSQSSPGDSPGCPRYLVPPGAKETAPITREPSVWVVKAVKGLRGGGDPARDGLHRPLLGK